MNDYGHNPSPEAILRIEAERVRAREQRERRRAAHDRLLADQGVSDVVIAARAARRAAASASWATR